jgi:hypothetical protein
LFGNLKASFEPGNRGKWHWAEDQKSADAIVQRIGAGAQCGVRIRYRYATTDQLLLADELPSCLTRWLTPWNETTSASTTL